MRRKELRRNNLRLPGAARRAYARTMGLFSKILGRLRRGPADSTKAFSTFTSYTPVFTSYEGSLYEQQLTRAAVDAFATAASKLKPEVVGSAEPRVRRAIRTAPNSYMTWSAFIYRVATILEVDTTAYVVPSYDEGGNKTGVWPLRARSAEVVEYEGEAYVRFTFDASEDGADNRAALPLSDVCILTRYQYESDFFGSGQAALRQTLELSDMQAQAQKAAMRDTPALRFIGHLGSSVRPEDVDAKREAFYESNLSDANSTGLLVYDNTWESVAQIEPKSYTVPTEEMERIDTNVYNYFGVNEEILQNKYTEDVWGAYYEGKVEPFAVQLGEGLTRILYTERERSMGNLIMFSANRLEYASNASKRNMVRDMLDRGIFTINEARQVLQLKPLPNGDVYVVRGEYYMLDSDLNLIYSSGGTSEGSHPQPADGSYQEKDFDLGGDDDIYNDTDQRGMKEEDDN